MRRFSLLSALLVMGILVAATAEARDPNPRVWTRNFVAHLVGGQQVPERNTAAVGNVVLNMHPHGFPVLFFQVFVGNIDNVVGADIHLGPAGSNGPVVACLAGPFGPGSGPAGGMLARGRVRAADLVGPLAGQDLSVLIEALESGNAYVNIQTDDGIEPPNAGPGDFPAGEIRGQIRLAGRSDRSRR